jgi:hypothetical protein
MLRVAARCCSYATWSRSIDGRTERGCEVRALLELRKQRTLLSELRTLLRELGGELFAAIRSTLLGVHPDVHKKSKVKLIPPKIENSNVARNAATAVRVSVRKTVVVLLSLRHFVSYTRGSSRQERQSLSSFQGTSRPFAIRKRSPN